MLLYDANDDTDRLPSMKLRTTRRVNGDCLATILALGGGLKRRKRSQQQVSLHSAVLLTTNTNKPLIQQWAQLLWGRPDEKVGTNQALCGISCVWSLQKMLNVWCKTMKRETFDSAQLWINSRHIREFSTQLKDCGEAPWSTRRPGPWKAGPLGLG